jgi:6-phosphogluconolactonase/glucosamine-6-phosphate isomerase/deaminase
MGFVFKNIADQEEVVTFITNRILDNLKAGKKVLWELPGGSAIAINVKVAQKLAGHDVSNLSITLTDERYGDLGHADSNWKQMQDAGFKLDGAKLFPVITGGDRATTVQNFTNNITKLLEESDYKLGFFGVGPDGHTSGFLPGSLALHSEELVASYDGGGYKRITTTPKAVALLDEAVVYMVGEAKQAAIDNLIKDLTIDEQPAQALKAVPNVTIFNDYKDLSL